MIERYFNVLLNSGYRPARGYIHDELSDWFVHGGDFSRPFFDRSKRAKGWRVTHVGSGRRICYKLPNLSFKEACHLALELDQSVHGMSQVRDDLVDGVLTTIGGCGEVKRQIRDVLNRWLEARGLPLLEAVS